MKKQLLFITLLLVTAFASAQTTLFSENFDSYTAGQTVNSQQPLFYPWTGTEHGYVSATQSHSPSNSMYIINDNDMVFDFGSKTSGEYNVNFWIYITAGQGGYFNVEHAFGTEWAFAFYFRTDGTCDLIEGGVTTNFAYSFDTWIPIELNMNLETDQAKATVNSTEILTWTFSNEEDATGGTNQLDVINFYGLHQTASGVNASNYFVDDFEYIEIQSGLTPPSIDVVTTPISADGLSSITHPFGNTGEEDMDYVTFAEFADPSITSTMVNGQMNYDGDNKNAIGWASSFDVYAAVKFQGVNPASHLGQEIVSIDVFLNDAPVSTDITVYVWEKDGFIVPGTTTIIEQKTQAAVAGSWNTVLLDNPVQITGEEIWVGYFFTSPAGGYTLGVDSLPNIPGTCYVKTGPVWAEFTGISGEGNFNIRANVEGAGWPEWLSVAPATGTVVTSGTQDLTLSFNTAELITGTYNANVVIGCNDPAQEWTEIPVTLDYVVGIDNINKFGVMTYPNPATEHINIVTDSFINSLSIYSISGQLVNSFEVSAASTTIDVKNMSKGNYVMEIKVGNDVFKRNFIVE